MACPNHPPQVLGQPYPLTTITETFDPNYSSGSGAGSGTLLGVLGIAAGVAAIIWIVKKSK